MLVAARSGKPWGQGCQQASTKSCCTRTAHTAPRLHSCDTRPATWSAHHASTTRHALYTSPQVPAPFRLTPPFPARASPSSANHRLCLEDVELPQNHPFATKQKLTQEQQDAALQNLRARSMRRRNYEAMQEGANGGMGGMGRSR